MPPTPSPPTGPTTTPPGGYQPRTTQDSTLVQILRTHLDEFLERTEGGDPDWSLPRFVERQLRAMVDCGDFTKGFVRLECCSSSCRGGRIVPFS